MLSEQSLQLTPSVLYSYVVFVPLILPFPFCVEGAVALKPVGAEARVTLMVCSSESSLPSALESFLTFIVHAERFSSVTEVDVMSIQSPLPILYCMPLLTPASFPVSYPVAVKVALGFVSFDILVAAVNESCTFAVGVPEIFMVLESTLVTVIPLTAFTE